MSRYSSFLREGSQPLTFRSTIYPPIPKHEDDIYIITRDSDRLDLLAGQYYEDVTLWWIIASANNIGKGTLVLKPGQQIRIPHDVDDVVNRFEAFNVPRG